MMTGMTEPVRRSRTPSADVERELCARPRRSWSGTALAG